MKRLCCVSVATLFTVALILCCSAVAATEQPAAGVPNERYSYDGTIRVYVTELVGRWFDSDSQPYHNAFLAFALEEGFSLGQTDTLTWYTEWDGHDFFDADGLPFDDIEEDNIKVIAAVFDSNGYTGYSDPPDTFYAFTVHEVDATAGATCGTTGYNMVNADFTHTVLEEDGTSTW